MNLYSPSRPFTTPSPAIDASPLPKVYRLLHEDDWRQIEFVAHTNHAHIQKELAALGAFKGQHRRGAGWTKVYIRREHPTPLAMVGLRWVDMPAFPASALGVGSGAPWGGTVKGGFALSDGGRWFIYGQRTEDGRILQLGMSASRSSPSELFAQAVSQLTKKAGLLLVDWYAGSLVDTSSLESVLAWAAEYLKS